VSAQAEGKTRRGKEEERMGPEAEGFRLSHSAGGGEKKGGRKGSQYQSGEGKKKGRKDPIRRRSS